MPPLFILNSLILYRLKIFFNMVYTIHRKKLEGFTSMEIDLDRYLENNRKKGMILGLENMKKALKALGNPDKKSNIIHVAGTNGKGSICEYIYRILLEAGYSVLKFSSPYLESMNSCININGHMLDEEVFARESSKLAEFLISREIAVTEFEFLSLLAIDLAAKNKIKFLILEVGMGGRLDATNAISKKYASVVANIGLDHTKFLGNSLKEITREKLAIVNEGGLCFAYYDDKTCKLIEKSCQEKSAKLFFNDLNEIKIKSIGISGELFDYKTYKSVELSMIGLSQVKNASLVLDLMDRMKEDFYLPNESIYRGLKVANLECRFELMMKNPIFIVDGAHNPQAVEVMIQNIIYCFDREKVRFIFGVLKDKNYKKIIDLTCLRAKKYYLIDCSSDRNLDKNLLFKEISSRGLEAETYESSKGAVEEAIRDAGDDGIVIAFGSFYHTYGIREILIDERGKNV